MNNHFTNINQVTDAFILNLVCTSTTTKYETTCREYHLTDKIQQLLNNDTKKIYNLLYTIEECQEEMPEQAIQDMDNLQVWLVESNQRNNQSIIKIGSLAQKLLEYEVFNLSISFEKLTLFIIPLYHTESWSFFVFHHTEYTIIKELLERLISMIDVQEPVTTVKFTNN